MNLKEALDDIVLRLREWEHKGLNEAQTSQSIVLRVLHELGYDIWNPFAVFPQETGNSGTPDYIITVNGQRRFVLEIKRLGFLIDAKAKTQAVAYANNQSIRWAILTNGIAWLLFDSFLVHLHAHERLVLALSLGEQDTHLLSQNFETLLHHRIWYEDDPDGRLQKSAAEIQTHLELYQRLQPLTEKFRQLMNEYTVQDPLAGLKLADKLETWNDEDSQLITANQELFFNLLGYTLPSVGVGKPTPATSVTEALIQGIASTRPPLRSSTSTNVRTKINGQTLAASSWRDIHAGIAEAFLLLGKETLLEESGFVYSGLDERHMKDGKLYPPHAYRRLSNDTYLFLHLSAAGHVKRCRKLLKALGVDQGIVEVEYQGDTYKLP